MARGKSKRRRENSDRKIKGKRAKTENDCDPMPKSQPPTNPMLVDTVLWKLFTLFSTREVKDFRLVCRTWNSAACTVLNDRIFEVKKKSFSGFIADLPTMVRFPYLDRLKVTKLDLYTCDLRFSSLFAEPCFKPFWETLTSVRLGLLCLSDINSVVEQLPVVMPQIKSLTLLAECKSRSRDGTHGCPAVLSSDIAAANQNNHLKVFNLNVSESKDEDPSFDFPWQLLLKRSPKLETLDLWTVRRREMWSIMSQINSLFAESGQTMPIIHLLVTILENTVAMTDDLRVKRDLKLESNVVDLVISFINSFSLKSLSFEVPLDGDDFVTVFSSISAPVEKLKLMHLFQDDSPSPNMLVALCGPNLKELSELEIRLEDAMVTSPPWPCFSARCTKAVTKLTLELATCSVTPGLMSVISDTFPSVTNLRVLLYGTLNMAKPIRGLYKFPKLICLHILCEQGEEDEELEDYDDYVLFGTYDPSERGTLLDLQNLEELTLGAPVNVVTSNMITKGFMKMASLRKLSVPCLWGRKMSKYKAGKKLTDKLTVNYF